MHARETCILRITKCTPDVSLVDEDCDGNVNDNDDDNDDDSRNSTPLTTRRLTYSNSLDSVKKQNTKCGGYFLDLFLELVLNDKGLIKI